MHANPMRTELARESPRLRVFLVENDADTRRFFAMYLERLGHAVQSAESVGEATTALAASRHDVLIVDIGLPDGTGWDLMRLLAERGIARPAYAVAMTGFGREEDRVKSEAAGFRHHLVKPIVGKKVLAILDEVTRDPADR